jgi:hypothetical protein
MKRLAVLALAVALAGALPAVGAAQDSTAAALEQARRLYEQLELERALPVLRQVLSPSWPFDVTAAQRVEAETYLGAALALLGDRDSAKTHFRRALERDPFADLDPARFTPAQLDAFQATRARVFALGVRPVAVTRLDPRTDRLTFRVVATHAASGRIEIRPTDDTAAFPVFVGDVQGLREIAWDGVLASGRLAPTGRYSLVFVGQSRLLARTDSTSIYFDVRQEVATLEDTLPELQPGDLLPERYEGGAATADVLKGVGIAAGAFVIANVVSNRDLGRPKGMAVAMGTVGVAAGVTTFLGRRRQRDLPANVAANARRRAERAQTNAAIRGRNADKIAQTVLLITPAAGAGR